MTQQTKLRERSNNIQSVQRAAAILKALGNGSCELGVSEVGRQLQLHKSTVSRLLATLEAEGLVERVPQSDKYRLGYEFVRLAGQAPHFSDLRATARPLLVELADATHETVNLAVLDRSEVINIDQVSGPHLVGATNWVGRRTPLHCVANGKALLAFRSRGEIESLLTRPLARVKRASITGKTALRAELARVRQQGFATALGELEDGLNAVAAPIRGSSGDVIAAISVSGPSYRVRAERIPDLGALCVAVANKISTRLGATLRLLQNP